MNTACQTGLFPGSPVGLGVVAGAAPQSLHKLIGGMARWLAHGSANTLPPMQRTSLRQVRSTAATPCNTTTAPRTSCDNIVVARAGVKTVRVLRVMESGQAPACVGRMVISGRMADVCAELDRLAAREAALH
jgi:hypothetical protein